MKKLSVHEINTILTNISLTTHQYLSLPGVDYRLYKILPYSDGFFKLFAGSRPIYAGTLSKCYKEALRHIESANYYLEQMAMDKHHIFCYLPHVKLRTEAYPKDS